MKTQVRWSETEIAVLKAYAFDSDLVQRLPRHTCCAIMSKRRSLGFRLNHAQLSEVRRRSQCSRSKRLIDQTLTLDMLDNVVYQLLFGSILGDGGVHRMRDSDFHFENRHGHLQQDYAIWKQRQLSVFHVKDAEKLRKHGSWLSCNMRTGVHPIFTEIRRGWYESFLGFERKRRIPESVDGRLDLLGLLIWYLDDGTRGSDHISLRIAGGTWKFSDLERVIASLNTRFGLRMTVLPSTKGVDYNHTVSIKARDRNILLPKWQQLAAQLGLPECMKYKLPDAPKLRLRDGIVRRSDGVEFRTQKEAAKATGISPSGVRSVLCGRQTRAGGFGWEFIADE